MDDVVARTGLPFWLALQQERRYCGYGLFLLMIYEISRSNSSEILLE